MKGAKIIIIDPQNDFTSPDGVYAKRHGIVQITDAKRQIKKLLPRLETSGVIILRSDYRENQFGEGMSMCLPGTFGNQIDDELVVDDRCTFFTKTEHSGFTAESFRTYLKKSGTGKLFLCGFLAEYCVRQTAIDALQQGYDVCLIEACIGTGDDVQERKTSMLKELAAMGAKIVNGDADPDPL